MLCCNWSVCGTLCAFKMVYYDIHFELSFTLEFDAVYAWSLILFKRVHLWDEPEKKW